MCTSLIRGVLEQLSRAKGLCQESSALLCRGTAESMEGLQGAGCRANSSPDPLLGAHKEPGSVEQPCPAECHRATESNDKIQSMDRDSMPTFLLAVPPSPGS